jgi:hypothetical protein
MEQSYLVPLPGPREVSAPVDVRDSQRYRRFVVSNYFSMFGFDLALPQPFESSQLPMISTLDSGMTD